MTNRDSVPIASLFDEGEGPNPYINARDVLRDVDVIIGIDVMSKHEFMVYGRETVKRLAEASEAEFALPLPDLDINSREGGTIGRVASGCILGCPAIDGPPWPPQ